MRSIMFNFQDDEIVRIKNYKDLVTVAENEDVRKYKRIDINIEDDTPFSRYVDILILFENLIHVEFVNIIDYVDVSDICRLQQIENLVFNFDEPKDLDFLSHMRNLKFLSLPDYYSDTIEMVRDLDLISIEFGKYFNQSLEPLKNMNSLREIYFIFNANFNQSLEPMKDLKNLEVLFLGLHFNQDLYPLKELTKLRVIRLMHDFNGSIDVLKDITTLEEITIHSTYMADIHNYVNRNVTVNDCAAYDRMILDAIVDEGI